MLDGKFSKRIRFFAFDVRKFEKWKQLGRIWKSPKLPGKFQRNRCLEIFSRREKKHNNYYVTQSNRPVTQKAVTQSNRRIWVTLSNRREVVTNGCAWFEKLSDHKPAAAEASPKISEVNSRHQSPRIAAIEG